LKTTGTLRRDILSTGGNVGWGKAAAVTVRESQGEHGIEEILLATDLAQLWKITTPPFLFGSQLFFQYYSWDK
jgi:hypothetical protein